MSETDSRHVPVGQVRVTERANGWYLIEISRTKKVKRLFVADNEYRQIIDAYPHRDLVVVED